MNAPSAVRVWKGREALVKQDPCDAPSGSQSDAEGSVPAPDALWLTVEQAQNTVKWGAMVDWPKILPFMVSMADSSHIRELVSLASRVAVRHNSLRVLRALALEQHAAIRDTVAEHFLETTQEAVMHSRPGAVRALLESNGGCLRDDEIQALIATAAVARLAPTAVAEAEAEAARREAALVVIEVLLHRVWSVKRLNAVVIGADYLLLKAAVRMGDAVLVELLIAHGVLRMRDPATKRIALQYLASKPTTLGGAHRHRKTAANAHQIEALMRCTATRDMVSQHAAQWAKDQAEDFTRFQQRDATTALLSGTHYRTLYDREDITDLNHIDDGRTTAQELLHFVGADQAIFVLLLNAGALKVRDVLDIRVWRFVHTFLVRHSTLLKYLTTSATQDVLRMRFHLLVADGLVEFAVDDAYTSMPTHGRHIGW